LLNRIGDLAAALRRRVPRADAAHMLAVEFGVVAALAGSLALAAPSKAPPAQTAAQVAATQRQAVDRSMLRLAADTGPDVVHAEPAVLRLQDLDPDQARAWNAAIPVAGGPNPAAKPFRLKTSGMLDEARAIDCMTAAIYYEAAWETVDGQRAVAQVVLNRVRHPAYPKTVCGVIFQGSERTTGCQFSFTCDGSLARVPKAEAWARARKVSVAALNGYVMRKVGNATHYHADYVAPYWSPSLHKVAAIGAHIFYRWTGGWGMPGAFAGRYAGAELDGMKIAALDRLATPPKVELVALKAPPEATAAVAEPAPAAPGAGSDAAAAEATVLTGPPQATAQGGEILTPEDLDWAGRPKKRVSRIAAPGF
jgi:spore germination cell wall hydrolase CwlJ-like protein